jgi:hypothetical protein
MSEGPSGAVQFHEFSSASAQINYEDWLIIWNDLDNPMIAMSSSDFAQGKKEIEDACAYLNNCTQPSVAKSLRFLNRAIQYSDEVTRIKDKN